MTVNKTADLRFSVLCATDPEDAVEERQEGEEDRGGEGEGQGAVEALL